MHSFLARERARLCRFGRIHVIPERIQNILRDQLFDGRVIRHGVFVEGLHLEGAGVALGILYEVLRNRVELRLAKNFLRIFLEPAKLGPEVVEPAHDIAEHLLVDHVANGEKVSAGLSIDRGVGLPVLQERCVVLVLCQNGLERRGHKTSRFRLADLLAKLLGEPPAEKVNTKMRPLVLGGSYVIVPIQIVIEPEEQLAVTVNRGHALVLDLSVNLSLGQDLAVGHVGDLLEARGFQLRRQLGQILILRREDRDVVPVD